MLLRFLDKPFPAAGTGNGDFALAPGDSNSLMALGAVEITILPVLQPVINLQEFPVFLIPLIGIAGQAAADGPDHQAIAQRPENQIEGLHGNDHGEQACHQARAEDHHIQAVSAIAAGHEMPQSGGQFCGELPKPAADSIHRKSPL